MLSIARLAHFSFSNLLIALIASLALAGSPAAAFGVETEAPVLDSWKLEFDPSPKILGLVWNKDSIRSGTDRDGKKFIEIKGQFKGDHSTLLIGQVPVKTNPDGRFLFHWPVQAKDTPLDMIVVDPKGEVVQEKLLITYQKGKGKKNQPNKNEVPQKIGFRYVLGVGLTYLQYAQTSLGTLTEMAPNMKASIGYSALGSKWDYGANTYYTGAPFGMGQSPDKTLIFYGINARAGYPLPFKPFDINLRAYGGLYLATASGKAPFSDGVHAIGYQVYGPQLFITGNKVLASARTVTGYVKLAPVTDKTSLKATNYESALGLGYRLNESPTGRAFGVSLDVSKLNLTLDNHQAVLATTSLGLNYNF